MNIAKYFWDLNEGSLSETGKIIKKPGHPKFARRMVTFLSRCDNPKELFSVISKNEFIIAWPKIKAYWIKVARKSDFRDWWQTIYEQLLENKGIKQKGPVGESSVLLKNIGSKVRKARLNEGLSQREFSLISGIKQPEISKIEEGKKNITMATLARLCKALGIRKIDVG